MADATGSDDPAAPTDEFSAEPGTLSTASGQRHSKPARRMRGATNSWVNAIIRLIFITTVFIVGALIFYPKDAQAPSPPYLRISIDERGKQSFPFGYDVRPHGATDIIGVYVEAGRASTASSHVYIDILFPVGVKPSHCPPPGCRSQPFDPNQRYWYADLDYKNGFAFVSMAVPAHGFGFTSGTVQAAASLPAITYYGPDPQELSVNYFIPDMRNYDWSMPIAIQNNTETSWDEQLSNATTISAQTVIGTNFAGERSDNYRSFIAGALIGAAGAALLELLERVISAKTSSEQAAMPSH